MKGKVASVVFKKSGEGKFGPYYIFDVKIEGDDKTYQYMSKNNPQNKFVAGQEVEFDVETKQNGQYTNYSIKPVQQGGFGGGGQNNAARIEVDKRIAALDGAISLVSSGKVHVDQLKATYDKLLNEYLN